MLKDLMMLKKLKNVPKNHNLNPREQLVSLGGGLLLLRKGITRPGIIGVVSLALGAAAIYRGAKAYQAHKKAQQLNEPPVLTNRASAPAAQDSAQLLGDPSPTSPAKDYAE